MRELTLYERSYCHLCDEMRAALQPWVEAGRIRLRRIDVDDDPASEQRFGILVPVLMDGDHEICHYHLDPAAVDARLAG